MDTVLSMHRSSSITKTYIIVSVGQIQCRFVLHVSQHSVSARLAEEVGDGGVLPPYRKMQGRASVEHGGVHIGSLVEEQLHRHDVMQLNSEVKSCFAASSFL